MKVTKLEIKDWGPHKHLVIDMDDPVVGIIGANGSGKSNVLQALNYALTGSLNKRTGASYIRNYGMPDGAEKASVLVEFTAAGKPGRIYREVGAKTSKRELVWDGKSYKKDADVKKLLQEVVGADEAALANAVFILQGTTANLVKGTPAERNDIFRKLMNLNFVEARANELLSKASALRAGIVDYTVARENLQQRWGQLDVEVEELNKRITDKQPVVDTLAGIGKVCSLNNAINLAQGALNREVGTRSSKIDAKACILSEFGDNVTTVQECEHITDEASQRLNILTSKISAHENCRAVKGGIEAEQRNITNLRDQIAAYHPGKEGIEEAVRVNREQSAVLADAIKNIRDVIHARSVFEAADMNHRVAEDAAIEAVLDASSDEDKDKLQKLNSSIALYEQQETVYRLKRQSAESGAAGVCPCCGGRLALESWETPQKLAELEAGSRQAASQTRYERNALSAKIAQTGERIAVKENQRLAALETRNKAEAALKEAEDRLMQHGQTNNLELAVEDESKLSDELSRCNMEFAALNSRLGSLNLLLRQKKDAEQRLADGENALMNIELPEESEQELRDIADRLRTELGRRKILVQQLKDSDAAINAADREIERLETEIAANADKADRLINTPALQNAMQAWQQSGECSDIPGDWDGLKSWLEKLKGILEAELAQLCDKDAELTQTIEKLAAMDMEIQKNARRKKAADDLDTIRSVVGKNGAPLMYMNSVFASITTIVQDLLQQMDSNFTVKPDSEQPVTFRFARTDNDSGFMMSQEQLSGGQAIRLALALLIAAQRVILPDVGLLVLDEPSSHIDADGVESMRDMFSNMSGVLESAGMQLIIVDHNSVLSGAFGKTTNLSA